MSYWEDRAAADKERAYADAEEVMVAIERLHATARRRAQAMARRIAQRFKRAYGLSNGEAMELLNHPVGREEYLKLLEEIERLGPKNPKRAQLLAKAAAPSYAHRISVAEAMEDELSAVCAQMAEREIKLLEKHLESTAIEQNLRAGFRLQQEAGVAWKFSGISEELAKKMIHEAWSGMEFSLRVWKSWDKLAQVLNTVLLEGIATGRSVYAMADDVAEAMGAPLHRARTLVRTETTKVCNDADFEAYKESGAEWYRYLATLDLRTSKICRDLDGTRHKVEDGVVGKNRPPMHPNCRSTTTADFTREELKDMERRARDPITGKTVKVPGDMTYKEWLKLQEETYGEERIEAAHEMARNEKRDKQQLEAYRAVIGEGQPYLKSREAFQQMKYLNPETYRFVQLDYTRQRRLNNDESLELPRAEQARAADEKFTKYLFNPESKNGWAKGVALNDRLGYNADNWEDLRKEVLSKADRYPAKEKGTNEHGTKYEQLMVLYGEKGTPANVKVCWILEGEDLHMTTMFIEEVKG